MVRKPENKNQDGEVKHMNEATACFPPRVCYNVKKDVSSGEFMNTKLSEKRKAAGLSQSQLAAASGVPLRTIQCMEIRQRDINKLAVGQAIRLADAIGCDVRDILE